MTPPFLGLGPFLGGTASRGHRLPVLRTLAFTGDSITRQNSTDFGKFEAIGYAAWARAFGGSVWDFQANGASDWMFATNSYTAFQVGSVHLPQVVASAADAVFVHAGTNDSANTSANVVAELLRIWLAIRAAGKVPIASTILPVTGPAPKSAWIVATNALIRTTAAANGVLLCDWTNVIDLGTNTGVTNLTFTTDGLHPGQTGAAALGRFLKTFLAENFTLPFDPWESPGTARSRNPSFAGTSGSPPTHWQAPVVPSGATLNSQSLVSDPETGGNWWQLNVTQGAATGFFTCALNAAGGQPSIVGMSIYAMVDFEVVSGTFATVSINAGITTATTLFDTRDGSAINGAGITSADGVITLRTPAGLVSGGTYYSPTPYLKGTGVIRFRRPTLYSVP